MPDSPMKV